MKFTPSLAILAASALSMAVTAQTNAKIPFTLRAWRDGRHPNSPLPLSIYVELDPTTGDAIINRTAGYNGFDSYLDSTSQIESLHESGTEKMGYLFPIHDMDTNLPHYQLRYSKEVPKTAGVLWSNFRSVGRVCGGNCGGLTLNYEIGGDRRYGVWYIFPKKKGAGGKKIDMHVWYLRWIGAKFWNETVVIPDDGYYVYLWKE
ncbi:hypothetical protein EV426DRAFT_644900 [Tirmania nivea]|nr:hypothetical protein EV426DRAFT_644900 [Tirmania nivea]